MENQKRPISQPVCWTGLVFLLALVVFFAGGEVHGETRAVEAEQTSGPSESSRSSFGFDGAVSRQVLLNYLSRAVSHQVLFTDQDPDLLADDIRMFTRTGAKFVGRASIIWDTPAGIDVFFLEAADMAAQVHAADPEIILQAGLFEIVDIGVDEIPIPSWVFAAFGLTPQARNFCFSDMVYQDGRYSDYFGPGTGVPDISRLEARFWFYYRARRYIDSGYEAIHLGVVDMILENDPDLDSFSNCLHLIRAHASARGRRRLVLLDAHHKYGLVKDGRTLFDFLSYPLRVEEIDENPYQGQLVLGGEDSIYGRTLGGLTPSGWLADRLPYLVEIDNWGSSGQGGQDIGGIWIWGWDEICWFARLGEQERNEWLIYAWDWVKRHDPHGRFQFPSRRILADPISETFYWYYANRPGPGCQLGFNQEDTIKEIWERDEKQGKIVGSIMNILLDE